MYVSVCKHLLLNIHTLGLGDVYMARTEAITPKSRANYAGRYRPAKIHIGPLLVYKWKNVHTVVDQSEMNIHNSFL